MGISMGVLVLENVTRRTIKVVQVWAMRGDGTRNDPDRSVFFYHAMDGELLGCYDPINDPDYEPLCGGELLYSILAMLIPYLPKRLRHWVVYETRIWDCSKLVQAVEFFPRCARRVEKWFSSRR